MTSTNRPTRESITDAILAGIVTISADAIICVDESQKIIFFNEGAESIFGYSAEEIMGQSLELLIPERFRATHSSHVRTFGRSTVKARRMGERGQILGLRRNGEEFPAEAAISHLGQDDQRVYSVVLRDVTDRRRAHETQRFLAEAGETLASSLGAEETLRNVAKLAVPHLADACVVHSFHGGRFHGVAVEHIDHARAAELERERTEHPVDPAGLNPVAEVIRKNKPIGWGGPKTIDEAPPGIRDELRDVFFKVPAAALIIPLSARDQLLGVMG